MRIRITSQHPGEVDGVPLSALQVGVIYEVSAPIGTYLISMGCAEPVMNQAEAQGPIAECVYGEYAQERPAVAADRGMPRRRGESSDEKGMPD